MVKKKRKQGNPIRPIISQIPTLVYHISKIKQYNHTIYTLGKGMNPIILPPAMGK